MTSLGLDIGSSAIKAAIFDGDRGLLVASATSPATELPIHSPQAGWAEQDPESWWEHVILVCKELRDRYPEAWQAVESIGIAYQMHGLVALDKQGRPVRPAIIWCDSRAVGIGAQMAQQTGARSFLDRNLNTPGNFTLSKMVWMAQNEPDVWQQVATVMLPGDYIAYRLTGERSTTVSGVSEMIAWDFKKSQFDGESLQKFDIKPSVLPPILPNFGDHGHLSCQTAHMLGLREEVRLRYRAGDQPNNAYGLGATNPGSVAMNAGTSGVVYAVSDQAVTDPLETYNVFVHVNDEPGARRNGMLFCLNGCGIVYAQMKRTFGASSYAEMNAAAADVAVGSEGLRILPFGNGAERMLSNQNPGASVWGWDFNRHSAPHWYRAAVEGVAASLAWGIARMRKLGVPITTVKAGKANLFLNPVFVDALVHMADVSVHLLPSDGALAAAKAAAFGTGDGTMSENVEATEHFVPSRDASTYANLKKEYFDRIEKLITNQIV